MYYNIHRKEHPFKPGQVWVFPESGDLHYVIERVDETADKLYVKSWMDTTGMRTTRTFSINIEAGVVDESRLVLADPWWKLQ